MRQSKCSQTDVMGGIATALATLRVTRLVTRDDAPPIQAARDAIIRRFGKGSSVAELVSCPFCSSVWIAFAVLGLRQSGQIGKVLVDGLALSGAVSAIWKHLGWDEEE